MNIRYPIYEGVYRILTFIESIYFKRFKREEPETVKPLKQIMAEMEAKKKLQKEKKKERKMQQETGSDII